MAKKEMWKMIPGSERYEVSNKGRVRNIETDRFLTVSDKKSVGITEHGYHTNLSVPKLVSEMF